MLKISLSILFGLFVSVLLLLGIELFFHLTDDSVPWYGKKFFAPVQRDIRGETGFGQKKGLGYRHHLEVNGRSIYDYKYNLVEDNMREVLGADLSEKRDSFVAVFGGSNAYGHGLKTEFTISSRLQKACSSCNVYSFAFPRFGPNMMLTQLEKGFVRDVIQEKQGKIFYFFASFHVSRVNGEVVEALSSNGRHPHYDWVDDRKQAVELKGVYREVRPIKYFGQILVGSSYLLRPYIDREYFRRRWHDWPETQTCAVIRQAAALAAKQFKLVEFYLVNIDAWSKPEGKRKIASALSSCTKNTPIKFIDISQHLGSHHNIAPEDHHLNAEAIHFVAELLIKDYMSAK